MFRKLLRPGLVLLLFALALPALAQQEPSLVPMADAHDNARLLDLIGRRAIVTGTIQSAQWSDSGKVMNITFDGPDTGLLAVVFERNKARFDKAFLGDFAKTVVGRRVRLTGQIETYGGYVESLKGRPQMVLDSPDAVTLVEVAPATRPAQVVR